MGNLPEEAPTGPVPKRCFTCQKPGHLAKECCSFKQQTNALDEELDIREEEEAMSFFSREGPVQGGQIISALKPLEIVSIPGNAIWPVFSWGCIFAICTAGSG